MPPCPLRSWCAKQAAAAAGGAQQAPQAEAGAQARIAEMGLASERVRRCEGRCTPSSFVKEEQEGVVPPMQNTGFMIMYALRASLFTALESS